MSREENQISWGKVAINLLLLCAGLRVANADPCQNYRSYRYTEEMPSTLFFLTTGLMTNSDHRCAGNIIKFYTSPGGCKNITYFSPMYTSLGINGRLCLSDENQCDATMKSLHSTCGNATIVSENIFGRAAVYASRKIIDRCGDSLKSFWHIVVKPGEVVAPDTKTLQEMNAHVIFKNPTENSKPRSASM